MNCRLLVAATLFLFPSGLGIAGEEESERSTPGADVQLMLDSMDRQRENYVKAERQKIAAMKNKKHAAEARKKLKEVEAGGDFNPILGPPFTDRYVGVLSDHLQFRVVQMVPEEKAAIVELTTVGGYVSFGRGYPRTVHTEKRTLLWIETDKNFADDEKYSSDEVFVVDGTKTYDTVLGGTSTVTRLRRFDQNGFDEWRMAHPLGRAKKR
jgi:hypothetical protein